MLNVKNLQTLLPHFRALSDANRLRLVGVLSEEPRSVESLAAELALPPETIAQHLKRLTDLHIVQVTVDGDEQVYSLAPADSGDLTELRSLSLQGDSPNDRPAQFETVLAAFRALSSERGLALVVALAEGPRRFDQLVEATGLSPQLVETHLALLGLGELVLPQQTQNGRVYTLQTDHLAALPDTMRGMTPPANQSALVAPPEDFDQKTIRDFMVEGRLKTIPSHDKKRQVILCYLAGLFEPGRQYPEREVNAILRDVYPDSASLRRYLVDSRLMARDHGVYWRLE
jgi:DNA-binding transcriptional ArsR family regulator